MELDLTEVILKVIGQSSECQFIVMINKIIIYMINQYFSWLWLLLKQKNWLLNIKDLKILEK
jgi:hypothetical protein